MNQDFLFQFGTLEATRTPDLRLRRQLLYPTELRGHIFNRVYYHKQTVILFQVNYEVYYIRPSLPQVVISAKILQ